MNALLDSIRHFLQGEGAAILPELELLLFAVGILLVDTWLEWASKHWNGVLALAGAGFSGYTLWILRARIGATGDLFAFRDAILVDSFFVFYGGLLLAGMVCVVLLSMDGERDGKAHGGKHYALLLLTCAAMMLAVEGIDLIFVFLAMAATAIGLALLGREAQRETESAGKFSGQARVGLLSAILLGCGLGMLYQMGGSANVGQVALAIGQRTKEFSSAGRMDWVLLVAMIATAAGFVSSAIWAWKSVADSAISACKSLLAEAFTVVVGGVVATALFLRLFVVIFGVAGGYRFHCVEVLAIGVLVMGNLAALWGSDRRRLIVYSALIQLGFAMLGPVARSGDGLAAMSYGMLAYVFSMAGVFAIGIATSGKGENNFERLFHRNAGLSLALLVTIFSLAWIPWTMGFVARRGIVAALFAEGHRGLGVAAVIATLPGIYYYGRILISIFRKDRSDEQRLEVSYAQTLVITVCTFVSLAGGLYPEPFLRLVGYALGN